MKVVHTISNARDIISDWKKHGFTIGLVPTMGYLHDGHRSLIERAVKENDKVVVSIFLNPIQFGQNEDLSKYPRDFNNDSELCEKAGAALIFNPDSKEMYMPDFSTYVDAGSPALELCGKSRPIHFRGVCTVVAKLLNIIKPERAYFGKKDAQQLAVIKRMATDLNIDCDIIGCPIIRENDGLAKSSRNVYLNSEERKAAAVLHKALLIGEEMVKNGEKDCEKITDAISEVIKKEPLARIDYIQAVSFPKIVPAKKITGQVLVAVAVYIGKTRLIDNFFTE